MEVKVGGDNITTHLVPLSTGIDMVECTIKTALGETVDVTPTLNCGSAIRYFEAPCGKIKSIEGIEEALKIDGVKQISFTKNIGDESTPIHCSNDRIGFVIAQASTAAEAIKVCEKAMNMIKIEIEYEMIKHQINESNSRIRELKKNMRSSIARLKILEKYIQM